MKKQEAIDLIKEKTSEGLSKEEITSMLMGDGKIGGYNATAEIINELFEDAAGVKESQNDSKYPTYEEYVVKKEVGSDKKPYFIKVKKVKEVRISESTAETLNRSLHNVQYYKK